MSSPWLFAGDTDLEWVTIMLAMAGKFSVSSSNAVMPVFTAELFPTVVRNLGVGSSNVPAGIALMLVPYLWNLVSIGQTSGHTA
jgi:OCT family organic cation transporter-like MFS transporter 4/5